MKKRILFTVSALCLAALLCNQALAVSDEAFSWYCVRNKEHKQPRVDANMSFIEKYNGYYGDKKHSDSSEDKVIYLTFDAGYENGNIEKILDVMKEEGVTGAFFILENLIKKEPQLVSRMADDGHIVANHTASHRDMTKIDSIEEFSAELNALDELYQKTTGKKLSKYYRPPEGRFDERSLEFASSLGYKTVFWSFAYADWDNQKQPTAESAKTKIFDNLHNGAVILLHPTSSTNAAIMSDLIRTLKADGYRFGTLDELTAQ